MWFVLMFVFCVFFFKQKTAYEMRISDWSSDVCSSDLATAQIGIPQRRFVKAFNETATTDGMRHFAFGLVGDDNPLWHDPDYAKNTRWRGPVAHPLFIQTMGINECPSYSPEHKALFRGLFRGIGKYLASTDRKSVGKGKSVSVRVD